MLFRGLRFVNSQEWVLKSDFSSTTYEDIAVAIGIHLRGELSSIYRRSGCLTGEFDNYRHSTVIFLTSKSIVLFKRVIQVDKLIIHK